MDLKLSSLVEELTTSGEPKLNPEKMKELKKICKSSEEHLSHAYHLLMAQLSQDHAEIRLSTFQAIDELFTRSHQFRMLVVSNFQEFLELTLGTDHEQPLPPPREVAQRLRQAATRAIQGWNEKYGAAYKKLALGYHFLRHSKQVDFQDVSARTLAERKQEEEKQKRLDRIYREKSERAIREMEEMAEEIRRCLTEVESCFRLLVPLDFATGLGASLPTAAFDVSVESAPSWVSARNHGDEEQPCCSKTLLAAAGCPGASSGAGSPQTTAGAKDKEEDEEEDSDRDSDEEEFVRCHGLGSHKYTLDVELSSDSLRVHEDEDNHAVIQSARESLKLIQNKFLPAVRSWVQLFTRAGIHGGHLEAAIDLKAELETTLQRSEELDIKPEEGRRREGWRRTLLPGACRPGGQQGRTRRRMTPPLLLPSVTTYVDARFLPRAPELPEDHWGWCQDQRLPWTPNLRAPIGHEEAGKLAAERARAPVVPFGVDLCYWGQEQPGKILKCDSEHRFWKPSEVDTEVDSAAVSEMLQSRSITFAGKFEPVQHRCRAPRPDGRLCERQDRLKCPFHGKIIPRDDMGQPLQPEDRAWEQRRLQKGAGRADWQDPELMRDVEAATGVDLGSSGSSRSGKGKRRKHPGLTDLKRRADTARARIAKKVFAKAAVQRVVTVMNQMDRKKHEKFANQFNYALN
ncbi:UV-stimulated scaffold protein A isoform X2 [Meles meles]|uniref:UV-stimulated scaffold protein A isoform X2 n=1 Tax=Meles meles TaxID=9662 RepID=UPI001E69CA7A|nr:UV-stimulated scaffold protein A isoform X2 [Meles meles]